MPTCVDGDIIRVTAKLAWSSGTNDIQNVYHLQHSGDTADDEDVHAAIANVLDDAYTYFNEYVPSLTSYETIETWNVTQDRPMVEDGWPVLDAGTGAGDQLPSQVAPLVLFNTATARSQGRKFLPSPIETAQAGSVLVAGILSEIADYTVELLDGVDGGTWTLSFGNYNVNLSRFAPWISAVVKTILRTQRRRTFGVGS